MKTVKVPLSTRAYKNVDGIELSDDSSILVDGYLDEAGGTNKRPGLSQQLDLGTGGAIDGLYWWSTKAYAIAVSAGRVFKITKAGTTITSEELTGATLESDTRVTFASGGANIYMANGGQIIYTGGNALAAIPDGDAPTVVTHVDWLDGYLLANSGSNGETQRVYFSDPDDNLDWTATDYFTVQGGPDSVNAIHTFNHELYVFGPDTTEIYETAVTDGDFSRIPSGYYDVGCIAPYSIVNTNESLFWLDDTKHFVEMNPGGGLTQLETDYDKEIQSFSTVRDCMADRIEISGKPFLVFHFPAENRTLVFNYRSQEWSEWRQYVSPSPTYNRWYGNCYAFCPNWNFHLVGARHDSLIYFLSESNYDDAGEDIRLYRKTGHIDYGTSLQKESKELRLRLKRGGGELGSEARMMMRWNDDSKGWSNEIEISLGDIGEYESPISVYTRGIYRTRQYEITITDDVPAIYIDAEEDIEVLDR